MTEPVTTSRLGFRDNRTPLDQTVRADSMRRARDGSMLWWDGADAPLPAVIPPGAPATVEVAVSPVRPGHTVTVEYRVNGGPVRQAIGLSEPRVNDAKARVFRAILPGQTGGVVEFLPVLRFAGQPISPRLGESTEPLRYQVSKAAVPVQAASSLPSAALAGQPRWAWDAKFFAAFTATLRKEVVGAVADGLRINWHVKEGSFAGPGLDGVVLPGAADWMRIRPDGIGVVNVTACLETRTGARIYGSYGGILDFGPDGYTRALRDEFDPLPPFVITPTYATTDKQLEWLNRAQCIAVGRVDMNALLIEYDTYVVAVGGRKDAV